MMKLSIYTCNEVYPLFKYLAPIRDGASVRFLNILMLGMYLAFMLMD